jgi:hypothetical protein
VVLLSQLLKLFFFHRSSFPLGLSSPSTIFFFFFVFGLHLFGEKFSSFHLSQAFFLSFTASQASFGMFCYAFACFV